MIITPKIFKTKSGEIYLATNMEKTMKKRFNFRQTFSFLTIALLALFVLGTTDSAFAQKRKTYRKRPVLKKKTATAKPAVPKIPYYAVAAQTRLRARMNDTLNSKTAKVGDTFTGTITEPVYSESGQIVIPSGSTVTGRVSSAKPAAKGGKPGEIDVTFVSIKLPNGRTQAINGSLTDLDSKNATSDPEGTAKGGQMKNRKLIFYGGGAAAAQFWVRQSAAVKAH